MAGAMMSRPASPQSVPSVIAISVALPYSSWGREHLPSGFTLDDATVIPAYTYEVLRRFPMVSGFSWIERSFGNTPQQHKFVNLHMGQHDTRVWGEDAGKFVLRPLTDYHKLGVGFAEPAAAPHNRSPNSRMCPAKDLAYTMVSAFLREFIRSAGGVEGGHKAYWHVKSADNTGDVGISMNGASSFDLHRNPAAVMPPVSAFDDAFVASLSEEERAQLSEVVERDNKFSKLDENTSWFIKILSLYVKPNKQSDSSEIKPDKKAAQAFEKWEAPIGSLKFLINEEGKSAKGPIESILKAVFFKYSASLDFDDKPSELLWFSCDQEAIVSAEATFGRCEHNCVRAALSSCILPPPPVTTSKPLPRLAGSCPRNSTRGTTCPRTKALQTSVFSVWAPCTCVG